MSAFRLIDGTGRPVLMPVEQLAMLVGRLRDVSRSVEMLAAQKEIERIAAELIGIREFLMADRDSSEVSAARLWNAGNQRVRTKNPHPGLRRCSRCGRVLPTSAFAFSDRHKGKLRSDCRDCYNAGQRNRYMRVGYKVVTVEVLETDPCVGHPCPVCGQPFQAGQFVAGERVRHAECCEPGVQR